MKHPRPALSNPKAFTLIEVLLAVSVFAIVLGAINSVFFGALRLRNKTIQSFETALPLQYALTAIQRDLEGIMLPGGRFAGSFTTALEGLSNNAAFLGERITPDIYTSSGAVGDSARWADVQKVAYFLALPTNGTTTLNPGKDLIRQVTSNLLPINIEETEVQWLMGGVDQIALQYYDGLNWADSWTDTNLPRAIKVQVTLVKDYTGTARASTPVELVVPVLVQASTSTDSTGGAE